MKIQSGSSRRRFLKLLTAACGATALSACRLAETPTASPAASVVPAPRFEGYSIFHETMVEMPWTEIRQAAQDGAIILLPVAVIEEHGPHMGLGADTYQTYLLCKLTREALKAKGIKALIAPPYYWGINASTGGFPGSFSVRTETMQALLYDIHSSLFQWGFKYVFSFNLHGDSMHKLALADGIMKIREELGKGAMLVPLGAGIPFPALPGASRISQTDDYHAGAYETAQVLAEFPMDVNTELAKTLKPTHSFKPEGYYGDPASFDKLDIEEIKKWNLTCSDAVAEWIKGCIEGGE